MTEEQVDQIIAQGEGLKIEFKEARDSVPKAVYESVVSFSWDDLLLHLVPSWVKNGSQLDELKVPKHQVFEEEKIRMVPSWNKNDTQLLTKKVRYLRCILSLATEPIGMKDLIGYLDYINEKYFRDNYLKPLRQSGLIKITKPGNANDPKDRNVITESGKAFLAGL